LPGGRKKRRKFKYDTKKGRSDQSYLRPITTKKKRLSILIVGEVRGGGEKGEGLEGAARVRKKGKRGGGVFIPPQEEPYPKSEGQTPTEPGPGRVGGKKLPG